MPNVVSGDTGADYGAVIGILNLDLAWSIELERAPDDGSNSPDTANSTVIDVVPGWTRKYVDRRAPGSGPWHYRWRTNLSGCSAGTWTDWMGFTVEAVPSTLPDLPNVPPVIVAKWEADQTDDTTGKITLEVIDFEQRVTDLSFNDKPGANSSFQGWKSSWDTSTGTKGADLTLTRTESFTLHEKHNTIVKGRVEWDAPEGGTRTEILSPYTMDTDRTPELYDAMMRVGAGDGSVFASTRGDADVATIYGRFAENSTPADPDGTETDGSAGEVSVNQQTLEDYDTGLDVSKGSTIHGKLRGENASGTLGPVVSLHLDRYDFDDEAEVVSVSGAIDEPDGSVLVSASGDDDVDTIYITVDENSDPSDPDGTENNTTAGEGRITTRTGTVDTDLQIDESSTAHIKARGENPDGTLGPVREARVERPRSDLVMWELEDTTSGSTGTASLTVDDPDTRVTSVEFQSMTDAGSWNGSWLTSWDSSSGTAGSSTTLTRSESVSLTEKHNTGVKVRITYTDRSGNTRRIVPPPVIFDVDDIAELHSTGSAIDDSDGSVVASAGGDDDTENIYVTVGENSDPSDPTSLSNDGQISGRSGSVDTGVVISQGSTAHVKYVGENSSGNEGPVKEDRVTRPTDSPSQVLEVDGSEDRAGNSWTVNLEVLGDDSYDVEVFSANGDNTFSSEDSYTNLSNGNTRSESGTLAEKVNTRVRVDAWKASDTHSDSNLVHRETLTFDPDKTPDILSASAAINDDGTITARADGDTDTASFELGYDFDGDGSPDETHTVDSGSVEDTSTGTVSEGTAAQVFVTAWSETGTTGIAATTRIKVARPSRDPGLEISTFTVVDDGTDINYTVDWNTFGNVTDADHDAEATFTDPSGSVAAEGSETSPQTTQSISVTDSGAGDGSSSSSDIHKVDLHLLDSSGNIIDSKSYKQLEAV